MPRRRRRLLPECPPARRRAIRRDTSPRRNAEALAVASGTRPPVPSRVRHRAPQCAGPGRCIRGTGLTGCPWGLPAPGAADMDEVVIRAMAKWPGRAGRLRMAVPRPSRRVEAEVGRRSRTAPWSRSSTATTHRTATAAGSSRTARNGCTSTWSTRHWVYSLSGRGALVTHTGRECGAIESAWLDEAGTMILVGEPGPGIVDDRDLLALSDRLAGENGGPVDDDAVVELVESRPGRGAEPLARAGRSTRSGAAHRLARRRRSISLRPPSGRERGQAGSALRATPTCIASLTPPHSGPEPPCDASTVVGAAVTHAEIEARNLHATHPRGAILSDRTGPFHPGRE